MTENKLQIKSTVFLVLVIILGIVIFFRATGSGGSTIKYSEYLMGTMVEVTLYDVTSEGGAELSEKAFSEIRRLEELFSSYKDTSEVSLINKAKKDEPIKLSEEVFFVLEKAMEIAHISHGIFDPTIGVMKDIWSFSGEEKKLPTKVELDKALELVDYRLLNLNRENSTVTKLEDGVLINLGGIAKGYIVGMAMEELKTAGLMTATIKAGGDLFILNETGEPIKVGVKHPRPMEDNPGELYGVITVHYSGAVTTSGDYERYFTGVDGKRYHHIIDTRTGYPATASQSATVFSPNPLIADVMSTTLFILGPKEGFRFLEIINDAEALIIDSNGKGFTSTGMKKIFKPA